MNPLLSDQQFYHGSMHSFQPGDIVQPAASLGRERVYGESGSQEHSYASGTVEGAARWGLLQKIAANARKMPISDPKVFQVAPVDYYDYEEDPDSFHGFRSRTGWQVLGEA